MRIPWKKLFVVSLVLGLATCKKTPTASSTPVANAVAQTSGKAAAGLQLVTKDRPDPSTITLSSFMLEEYDLAAIDGDFYAPALVLDFSTPAPDYYTYTACNRDTKACTNGQFVFPGDILCGFEPGTYDFTEVKGCTENSIDGKVGGCSRGWAISSTGGFKLEASTSSALRDLMQNRCQQNVDLTKLTTTLFASLADPVKTSPECADGFSQTLDYGPISYAYMLYNSVTPPPLQAPDPSSPSSADQPATGTDPVANTKHQVLVGVGAYLIYAGAAVIAMGALYLWKLKSPYRNTDYEYDSKGKRTKVGSRKITKAEFAEALSQRPTERPEYKKRLTSFWEKRTLQTNVTESKNRFTGEHSIEIEKKFQVDAKGKNSVKESVHIEGVDGSVKLRRAGAVAAMFAGAGMIAVGGAMVGGAMGLADVTTNDVTLTPATCDANGKNCTCPNSSAPACDSNGSNCTCTVIVSATGSSGGGTPPDPASSDIFAPVAACIQNPEIQNTLDQITAILQARDTNELAIEAILRNSQAGVH